MGLPLGLCREVTIHEFVLEEETLVAEVARDEAGVEADVRDVLNSAFGEIERVFWVGGGHHSE